MTLSKSSKFLGIIIFFAVLFSLIPMMTRNVIPQDMVENLYWGKELQLGYAKHPPLFAWISYFFYKLCFCCPGSMYILTQLNLLAGFFFIFKTSELIFNDKSKSYMAVLIFMASVCAVFGNEKFNASTILMSLFPAMFFYFLRMLKFRQKSDAVVFGIFSALAFIGKYFALFYLGCIVLFVILDDECRDILKTPLPYISALVFLICISWHLYWIFETDFISIKYALEKSTHAKRNFLSGFNFILMQFVFFFSSFWAFAYSYSGKMKLRPYLNELYSREEKFILFITIAPNVILFLMSLLFGMRIGSFWGTNMLMTVGIYLLIINKQAVSFQKLFKFTSYIIVAFSIILFLKLGAVRSFLKETDPVKGMDFNKIARIIEKDWAERLPGQRLSVIKADKATSALHIYLQQSPSLYDSEHCDLFDIYNRHPCGQAVLVTFLCAEDGRDVDNFRNYYGKSILFENTIQITRGGRHNRDFSQKQEGYCIKNRGNLCRGAVDVHEDLRRNSGDVSEENGGLPHTSREYVVYYAFVNISK